jgi:hypothetical protein
MKLYAENQDHLLTRACCLRRSETSFGFCFLKEFMLKKFDRLKKKFGEASPYEVLQLLVEKELMQPEAMQRARKFATFTEPAQLSLKLGTMGKDNKTDFL